jgi:hypothetical protein
MRTPKISLNKPAEAQMEPRKKQPPAIVLRALLLMDIT